MHEPMKGNGYDGMESDSFAQLVNVSLEKVLLLFIGDTYIFIYEKETENRNEQSCIFTASRSVC